jgi:hypothetical protein
VGSRDGTETPGGLVDASNGVTRGRDEWTDAILDTVTGSSPSFTYSESLHPD